MGSENKQAWEPMQMVSVGGIAEVVKGGGGKLTSSGGDPGEQRKEQPSG
jgi:hypothetical protein